MASTSTCNYSSSGTPLHVLSRLTRTFFQAAHLGPRASRHLRHICKPPAAGDKELEDLMPLGSCLGLKVAGLVQIGLDTSFVASAGRCGCQKNQQMFLGPKTYILKLRNLNHTVSALPSPNLKYQHRTLNLEIHVILMPRRKDNKRHFAYQFVPDSYDDSY